MHIKKIIPLFSLNEAVWGDFLKMILLEKKTINGLLAFALHFILSVSVYASDDEPSFLDSLLGSPKKPVPKTSSVHMPLRSHNPQVSQIPQRIIPQEVNQPNEHVSTFLQTLPKILKDMSELEKHIPTLIPGHRLNPANLRRQPKSGDWRVLMAWAVKESDTSIAEKVKEINVAVESLNKKKALEKIKGPKTKPQSSDRQNPSVPVEETGYGGIPQLPEMLRLWFFRTCNPIPQKLSKFLQDYKYFAEWWGELPPQFMKSEDVLLLNSLLEQKEDNPAIILSLLDNLLVESLLLRAQQLYEAVLPIFMDLKTSNATMHSLREEAAREDALLKEILENARLYKQIEAHIGSVINASIDNYLNQITEEGLQKTVRDAFAQGLEDALAGKSDSLGEKGLIESQDSASTERDEKITLKENLRKVIVNVIRDAIQAGLNQATGRVKKDEQGQGGSSWKSSSKNVSVDKMDFPNNQSLMVDISPIEQILTEFIKPPEQTTSRTWLGYLSSSNKSPVAPKFISVDIPRDIQKQWEIPSYRMVTRSQQTVRKFPKVDDITPILTGVFKEIRSLRDYKDSFLVTQPQNLQQFIDQKKNVRLLFDLPKAYVYSPGVEGAQLLPKILRFFEQYEALITNYRENLHKSDLSFYLDPTRLSSKFCKSNKDSLFSAFPLLDPTELMHDWISIEVVSLLERKFLEDGNKNSFVAELEENIFLLAMVDGFADESLKIDTLDISRLIRNAKKVLFFKEKYQALKMGKTLSEEDKQALSDKLFQEKCDKTKGVNEAIKRMLIVENSKLREEDENYRKDCVVLVAFFTDLFRETLTECLYGLGLTDEKLEALKRISSPLHQKLGDDQIIPIPMSQPLNPSAGSQSKEDAEVTFHVPVTFKEGSGVAEKSKVSSSSQKTLKQNEDETGLPPVQELQLSGVDSLF